MPTEPSRRAVLRAVGLGVTGGWLAACTGSGAGGEPPPPLTADQRARAAAAVQETALADRARRTAERHPTLATAADAAAAHAAHAEALSETLDPASPSPTGSASGSPPVTSGAIPAGRTEAARQLAAAEDDAAAAHGVALAATGVTGELARLLASVAASDAAFGSAVRAQGERS